MFISSPQFYASNLEDARSTHARPAVLSSQHSQQPAVAIFIGRRMKVIMPHADAVRVATQIIDAMAEQKRDAQ